jgi:hypothetical protein
LDRHGVTDVGAVIEISQQFAVGPECRIKISIDCQDGPSTDDVGQYYCRRRDGMEISVESARFKAVHLRSGVSCLLRRNNTRVRRLKQSIVTPLLPIRNGRGDQRATADKVCV